MHFREKNAKSTRIVLCFSPRCGAVSKIRYCDAIDNSEYEPLMQNLLLHAFVCCRSEADYQSVDILNKDDFEQELEELGSFACEVSNHQ